MPRIRRGTERSPRPQFSNLVAELADELKSSRSSGQPVIEEEHFESTSAIRVSVIWDQWEPVPDDERVAIILEAYRQAESQEFRDRIALASGLTISEAAEAGLLPFEILPLLRKGDAVSLDDCREAMMAEGASVLTDPNRPQLRFSTREQAEACVQRLTGRLPSSEQVWVITQDVQSVSSPVRH